MSTVTRTAFTCFILLLASCSSGQSGGQAVVYSVTAYDSARNIWTVEKIDRAKAQRTKFVLACDYYQWGKHKPATGPTQCDLSVGDEITPTDLSKPHQGSTVLVWQSSSPSGSKLVISRSGKDGEVMEQFSVLSANAASIANGT